MVRPVLLVVLALLLAPPLVPLLPARAWAAPRPCLSTPQARALTQAGKIVTYVAALRTARGAAGGEMIDSRLCAAGGNRFEYIVTFLGEDGRVKRVTVDAQSGAVTRAR